MKANEFVKKVGINAVKSYIKCYEDHLTEDLKRLVESHELVEKHGGLLRAKSHYEKYKAMGSESNIILFSAIAGVESCL